MARTLGESPYEIVGDSPYAEAYVGRGGEDYSGITSSSGKGLFGYIAEQSTLGQLIALLVIGYAGYITFPILKPLANKIGHNIEQRGNRNKRPWS